MSQMNTKKTFYITTPIYYPSGRFHIGTAYSTILADMLKRYKSLRGFETWMLTGTDEHGQKIQSVAISNGISPQEHVDNMANMAIKLWKKMNIQNDDFIRTTDNRHVKVVQAVFDKLMDQGDIYLGEYEGWYCTPCETYFTDSQLVDGKCPDCGRAVQKMKEKSYFFNMKKYQSKIEKFYEENPDFIVPTSRKNEIFNNFIKPGIDDLCVSRTTFDWGIKVPKDPEHVVYVWLDALLNYISALGYLTEDDKLFKKFWPADVHIVGKDITRFHAIYWPIFLIALNLQTPKKIYAHGWILMKDGKMSKSKGNVVYPDVLADRYSVDAVRYFLLREMQYEGDGLFTPEGFVERYNTELCNDLGNLVNRTIAMINKYNNGVLPIINCGQSDNDVSIENVAVSIPKEVEEQIETFHISNALSEIMKLVSRSNKYVDESEPWVLFKNGEKGKLDSVLYHLAENIRRIAILLKPFIPETSDEIIRQLGIEQNSSLVSWDSLEDYFCLKDEIKVTTQGTPLFLRLDQVKEVEYIKQVMKGDAQK
jgi:methionyl-tRNA synthetase